MKIHIYVGFWGIPDVVGHPNCLFVFGDNDVGQGQGGQAVIRYCPNSVGIPTKKFPSNHPRSFYTDDEYWSNITKIDNAFKRIYSEYHKYDILVLPQDGLGTGLSQLPTKAPHTYQYLVDLLNRMIANSIMVDLNGYPIN